MKIPITTTAAAIRDRSTNTRVNEEPLKDGRDEDGGRILDVPDFLGVALVGLVACVVV
jgi:hypothetical protein